jgi:phage terminase small subunit
MALTAKQEAFAQAVTSGKTQADAYRSAFNAGKMKAETIQQSASRLMADRKVSARVAELRKPVVEAVQITLAAHLDRLAALSDKAEQEGKYSAAVAAEVARGKASGLYVDKMEHTGKDGAPIDMSIQLSFVKPA